MGEGGVKRVILQMLEAMRDKEGPDRMRKNMESIMTMTEESFTLLNFILIESVCSSF